MTKLEEKKEELIGWLDKECPSTMPPLEAYITADLSHGFAESLRNKLDEIALLKEQGEKEPVEQPGKEITEERLHELIESNMPFLMKSARGKLIYPFASARIARQITDELSKRLFLYLKSKE